MPPNQPPSKIPEYSREFFDPDDLKLCDEFLSTGRVIRPVEDRDALNQIQTRITTAACEYLNLSVPEDATQFLNSIHQRIKIEELNSFRLHVIQKLNSSPTLRPSYFKLARRAIETLVGNELTFQRRLNLSIQLPQDDSSLLEAHADVWSGDSPYEVVLWVPLVDCFRTKSMYLASVETDREVQSKLNQFESSEAIYQAIAHDAPFLNVPFGNFVIFSQNIIHGNRVNEESESRWSINARFKSVLSPYCDKKHAEFFEPISLRPATRLGLDYRLPGGTHE